MKELARLRVWLFSVAVGALLALGASCGGSGENGVTSENGDGPAPSNGEFEFVGTIKIGGDIELSGPQAEFGLAVEDGATVAVAEINAAGGVLIDGERYRLEFIPKDNRSDPTTSVVVASELAEEGIVGVFPPDRAFDAAYEIFKEGEILVFGGNPQSNLPLVLAPEDNPLLFVVAPLISDIVSGWLRQIRELFPDAVRLAILTENNESGASLNMFIGNLAPAEGFEVVARDSAPVGTTDFSSFLTSIKAEDPDLVFTGVFPQQSVPATQQAADLDVAPYLWAMAITPEDLGTTEFRDASVILTHFGPAFGESFTPPQWVETARRFDELAGRRIATPSIAILEHDLVWLLKGAIEEAGTFTDTQAIAQALPGQTYESPFGLVRMQTDHSKDGPNVVYVVEGGEVTFHIYSSLKNESVAESSITLQSDE